MQLCKDCRWVQPGSERTLVSLAIQCMHPKALREEILNVVNGETIRSYHLCMTFRDSSHPCGPDAVLFEAREA